MSISKEDVPIPVDIQNQNIDEQETISTEEILTRLNTVKDGAEKDNLKKIIITQEIFEQIKKSLADTVKSIEKNPSIFSRAAEFWGGIPLWQKILGGVVLAVPTLVIGIAAHIGFLLAICGVTTIIYAGGGIILDDHHKCSTSVVDSLQKGILGLADLLELTINALEIIRKQLEEEIQKFADENEKLTGNITSLSDQINLIECEVQTSSKINCLLNETKEGLNEAAASLKEKVAQQSELFEMTQGKLILINKAFSSTQSELAAKLTEIDQLKGEFGDKLKGAEEIIKTLAGTLVEFSATIGNEEKQLAFQKKLDVFITDKESSFLQIAERICAAEQKLEEVQKELENTNMRYQELLEVQKGHIDRLEELSKNRDRENTVGQALSQKGLYAVKKERSFADKEQQVCEENVQSNLSNF